MSTNYYIKSEDFINNDKALIGVRVGLPLGELGFIRKMNFFYLREKLLKAGFIDPDNTKCIINEYNEECTLKEFMVLLSNCKKLPDQISG